MEPEQEENIPEPTKELSKSIKAIGKDTVHKICSGQVVLNLAIAIKELVENSIDAGATLVEVKLKEQGLESVEVSDNGTGVEESNLAGMTAKYHTSKLREFSDLESVATFGFRGEALSSLCALSDMVVTTRHVTSEIGVRLELDHNGKIKKQSPSARQIGTTVTLSNLFSTLPVRKREFTKNIKKEFTKMCQILQAYCLVSKGVRIMCTNQNEKGVKTTILSTHGSKTALENIQAVFGSKQCQDLIEMKQPVDDDDTYENLLDLQDPNSSLDNNAGEIDLQSLARFKIEGWISSCSHGSGRSSKDRQYFFINTRPCEPKNIMKIVNEMYHRYNVHQYPFVFLNILIATSDVDVNLTPDKRQLLVNNEKMLLLAIKRSLLKTFGNIPSTFKLQNSIRISDSFAKDSNLISTANEDSDDETAVQSSQQKFMNVLSQWKATGDTNDSIDLGTKPLKRKRADDIMAKNLKMKKIQEYLSQGSGCGSKSDKESFVCYKSDPESDDQASEMSFSVTKIEKESKEFDVITQRGMKKTVSEEHHRCESTEESSLPSDILTPPSAEEDTFPEFEHRIDCKVKQRSNSPKLRTEKFPPSEYAELPSPISQPTNSEELSEVELILDDDDDHDDTVNQSNFARESSETISTSIEEIEQMVKHDRELKESALTRTRISRLKFKAEINPNKNKNAEEELQREITKDMFCKMDIIGQFNLGFIIVRLDNDLFIVDQHATDEKYNFEDLQKRTVLQNQKLAVPQSLELTTVNEMILVDNLEVFEANGFKFHINEDAPVTRKVKLLAKPFSKNWVFGKDDIDELIFMLQDAPPNTMCRPSRIRAMFASRSCRKSVMIGKPLRHSVMRRLINHMGEIEQPWNCPHGRPTMRHLVNLAMLQEHSDDDE